MFNNIKLLIDWNTNYLVENNEQPDFVLLAS